MEVIRLPDAEACARRTAQLMAEAVDGGARHLALSGGSSPERAYELLGPIVPDWSLVDLWYSDERCVRPDHADSNHRMASQALQAPGAVWHRIEGELGPKDAARNYARELGGIVMDVALQGMGPDGHTASLFPDRPELDAGGICIGIRDSPKPPPERVTMTLEYLNRSARILLLVAGEGKADALARVLAGPDRGTPASLLARDRLTVVADEAALGG
jgi:6-phosphogluconolactonase